jgi:hypothetical protein
MCADLVQHASAVLGEEVYLQQHDARTTCWEKEPSGGRLPSASCHHQSKRLPLLLKDRYRGNTVPLPARQHLLAQLLHRPYQHRGHLRDLLRQLRAWIASDQLTASL